MWVRTTLLRWFLGATVATVVTGRSLAELMNTWFPDGVPAYDMGDETTPETRQHPELQPLGIHAGTFDLGPRLDEALGYDTNASPASRRRGSWLTTTAPLLTAASDRSGDAIGATAAAQDSRYLTTPAQNRTDVTLAAASRLDIGNDRLTLAASHVEQHEDRTGIDTIASDRPIALRIDDVRATYTLADGRWTLEPGAEAAHWTYAATTIGGTPVSQAYRDRTVLQAGTTLLYEMAPLRSLLFVLRTVDQTYPHTPAGQPSPDSLAGQALAGIDYDLDSIWRLRLLAGVEQRRFASRTYPAQTNAITESAVSWAPTGLTNIQLAVSRGTQDAAQEGVSGLTLTSARLSVEHEYLRDQVFKAVFGWRQADFFQGGHQTGTSVLLGVTKVLNRSARVSVTYAQNDLHGTRTATDPLATGYSRGLALLTVSFGI